MPNEASNKFRPTDKTGLHLTHAQEGAILVGMLDCPLQERSFLARLAVRLQSLLNRRRSWIHHGLANPKLEALRLWVCLQRHPDPALDSVVHKELATEFSTEQLAALTMRLRRSPG